MKIFRCGRTVKYCYGIALAVLLPGVTGCRTGGGSHDDAAVRLINAVPAADDLSVAVDGQRVWKHSPFRSNTGFQGVRAGTYKVEITADLSGQRQTGYNYLQCRKGKAYTVVAINPQQATGLPPALRIFTDDRDTPIPYNQVRLRLINAGDGLGHVDALFNNIVGLGDVAFGARSAPMVLAPGTYDVKINPAEEAAALVGPSTLRFQGGRAYTLVVMGRSGQDSGARSLTLEAYPDNQ